MLRCSRPFDNDRTILEWLKNNFKILAKQLPFYIKIDIYFLSCNLCSTIIFEGYEMQWFFNAYLQPSKIISYFRASRNSSSQGIVSKSKKDWGCQKSDRPSMFFALAISWLVPPLYNPYYRTNNNCYNLCNVQ